MLCVQICQRLFRALAGLWIRGGAEADRLCPLPAPGRLGVNGPGLGWSLRASAKHSQSPSAGAELAGPAQPPASKQGPRPPWAQPQQAAGRGVPVTRQAGECGAGLSWLPDALSPLDPCSATPPPPRPGAYPEVPQRLDQKGPSQALPRICCAWGSRDPEPDRRALVLVKDRVTGPWSAQHADFTSCEQKRHQAAGRLLQRGVSVPR